MELPQNAASDPSIKSVTLPWTSTVNGTEVKVEVELVDTTSNRAGGRGDYGVLKLFNYENANAMIFCLDAWKGGYEIYNLSRLYEPELHKVSPHAKIVVAITKKDEMDGMNDKNKEYFQQSLTMIESELGSIEGASTKPFVVSAKTKEGVTELFKEVVAQALLGAEAAKNAPKTKEGQKGKKKNNNNNNNQNNNRAQRNQGKKTCTIL